VGSVDSLASKLEGCKTTFCHGTEAEQQAIWCPGVSSERWFSRSISSFKLLVWVKRSFSNCPKLSPLPTSALLFYSGNFLSLPLVSRCRRFHLRELLFEAAPWPTWSGSAPLTSRWSWASLHHLRPSPPCIFRMRSALFRSKNQFRQFLNLVSSIKSRSRAANGSWQASVTEQILPVNGTSPQPSVCNVQKEELPSLVTSASEIFAGELMWSFKKYLRRSCTQHTWDGHWPHSDRQKRKRNRAYRLKN